MKCLWVERCNFLFLTTRLAHSPEHSLNTYEFSASEQLQHLLTVQMRFERDMHSYIPAPEWELWQNPFSGELVLLKTWINDSDYCVSLSRLLPKVMIQRECSNVNFHAAWHVIMNRTMVERRVLEILVSIVMQYCHI